MTTRQLHHPTAFRLALFICVLLASVNAFSVHAAEPAPEPIRALRQQRVVLLKSISDDFWHKWANGGDASMTEYLLALVKLQTVQLELAQTAAERIAILKENIEVLKKHEAYVASRVPQLTAQEVEVFQLKEQRLENEIEIAKLKDAK